MHTQKQQRRGGAGGTHWLASTTVVYLGVLLQDGSLVRINLNVEVTTTGFIVTPHATLLCQVRSLCESGLICAVPHTIHADPNEQQAFCSLTVALPPLLCVVRVVFATAALA